MTANAPTLTLTGAIRAVLIDECGPLTPAEIIERLPGVGYTEDALAGEVVAAIHAEPAIEYRGEHYGYSLVWN